MSRLRHIAAVFRWPFIGALAAVTIGLGVTGFLSQADLTGTDRSVIEAFYRTMQLFVLEWSGLESPMPGTLEVARFLAPLVAGLAAAKTIAVIFRVEIERLWVRLFGRGHVVVCGQGETGWRLAATLREAGCRVAGIEIGDPVRPVARWALIAGDATEPETLRRAAAHRATHLVVLCGDDATNIAVARTAREVGGTDLAIHVLVTRPELAVMLRSEAIASHDGRVLEFFTLEERGSRIVLDTVGTAPDVVVTVGSSPLANRIVVDAARRWSDLRIERSEDSEVPDLVSGLRSVVLVSDAPDALTDALALVHRLRSASFGAAGGTTDVFVLSPHARNLGGIVASTQGTAIRVHAFDLAEAVLTDDLVESGAREIIARAVHGAYRRTAALGASMLPAWDELGEHHREASRAAADAVGSLFRAVGCDLVAATPDDAEPLRLLPSEVELMALLEHDRWLSWTAGRIDLPDTDNQVDWFDLAPAVRDRTKQVVRHLPTALRDVGQRVVRLERSQAQALHEAYVERHLALGETIETNPSLVPWDRLPESLRDSNRDQLAHLRMKLRSISTLR